MFRPLPLIAGLALAVTPAVAAEAAPTRPVVVELFTSQGCSSCPPADAYLTRIVHDRPDVLALTFHVTYWNNLGWTDPFSFKGATDRQLAYAQRFGDQQYTPEMVVDGRQGVVGSDRTSVDAAIGAAKADPTIAPVTFQLQTGHVRISVGSGMGAGQVLLLGYDDQHQTAVRRGENGGRTLTESHIVRSIRPVGAWNGQALDIDAPMPEGERAAVLVQAPDGRIIGAAQ
ncbi:MAG TPA: DUF1223 domain-containing protein [Stellaceae bacterium]|jgi:hypothetical protein|nr:DUF1223 domain-containing protein [Stellaceae bacterium]